MATWGKLKINLSKYNEEETLYYEYHTVSDIFYFRFTWLDNDWGGDGKLHKTEERQSSEHGEALMEAYINHYMAMNCGGDINNFVERYITNNRFKNGVKVE